MLAVAVIRANLEAVQANCRNRNAAAADPARAVRLDDERKRLVQEAQTLQQRANEVSKSIPKEKDAAKKQELIAEGKRLREQVAASEKAVRAAEDELKAALLVIPNLTHPDAPVGTTPADNKVIKTWGERRTFDFKAKDHVTLVER